MIGSEDRKTTLPDHAKTRARGARKRYSTTNVMLFEQRLVTRLVLPLDVIEKRTARSDHFQKPTTRMIVLHVGFEMPGEVVDAFRQDRNLNLGRAGVAGLVGIRLDDFRFTFGGYRHRQTLSLLRAELAVSPVRLNTRLGMSSPLQISARARSRPSPVKKTVPLLFGASRPRNKTAWPRWSLAASARVTASAGMSSSAVSTGKSASARLPSPDAALSHKASNCSSRIMSFSPNGPTRVRRSAQIWP